MKFRRRKQLTRFSKKVIVMKWTSYCLFHLHGQLLNKYICFERCTKAASGTIFHGAVSLSWRLRQVRSPTNLPSIFLRSNCDFRKLRRYQPWKWSSRKLYQYLSTGSTSTCSQSTDIVCLDTDQSIRDQYQKKKIVVEGRVQFFATKRLGKKIFSAKVHHETGQAATCCYFRLDRRTSKSLVPKSTNEMAAHERERKHCFVELRFPEGIV